MKKRYAVQLSGGLITSTEQFNKTTTQSRGKASVVSVPCTTFQRRLEEETEGIHFDSYQQVRLCVCQVGKEPFDNKFLFVKQGRPNKINAIPLQLASVALPHWQPCMSIN